FCSVSFTSLFYTLSLHDALPILVVETMPAQPLRCLAPRLPMARHPIWPATLSEPCWMAEALRSRSPSSPRTPPVWKVAGPHSTRLEEHTSELQSPYDLVCRLLLE